MRGRLSRSLQSMTTRVDRPVRSSTRSSMVTPSRMSPNFTVPGTSVSIGTVYGSHSAISWPALTGSRSRTFSLAPYTIEYRSRSRSRPGSGISMIATSPLRLNTTRSPFLSTTVLRLMYLRIPSLRGAPAGGAADVERTHGQLRARLADRLRRDDADRLAEVDHVTARQVAAVAADADALP